MGVPQNKGAIGYQSIANQNSRKIRIMADIILTGNGNGNEDSNKSPFDAIRGYKAGN